MPPRARAAVALSSHITSDGDILPKRNLCTYIHLRTTEHIIISVGISQNDTAMKSAQADFDIQGIIYYYYLIKFNVRIEPLGYDT